MRQMLGFSSYFHIGIFLIFASANPDSSERSAPGFPRDAAQGSSGVRPVGSDPSDSDRSYAGPSWNAKRLLSKKEPGTSKLSASAWADLGSRPRPSTNPASRTTVSPATTPPTAR